jgi:uncharacterized protein
MMKPPVKVSSEIMSNLWIRETENGLIFKVHLNPRSSKNCIVGIYQDTLSIKITAPPLEGKANKLLEELIARSLGLNNSSVKIISGKKTRNKTLLVEGITSEQFVVWVKTVTE